MPNLSVLDCADVPEIKSHPKRSFTVLEYFNKLKEKSHDDYKRAIYFLSAYFSRLPGGKKNEPVY